MGMLVAGRLMQGLGAGAISVSLYVMVGRSYPEHLRPKVFAAFSAGWVVPSMVGPALSGLIVQHLAGAGCSWRCHCWRYRRAAAAPGAGTHAAPSRTADDGRGNVVRWASGASLAALLLYFGGQQQGMACPALHRRGDAGAAVLRASAAAGRNPDPAPWPAQRDRAARHRCSGVLRLRGLSALLLRERGLSPSWAGAVLSLGALGWFAGSWLQGHQQRGWSRQQLLRAGT
jgi:MFS family permease